MTVTEKTISMIKTLPEADVLKVENFIRKLQRKHDPIEKYFPKLTTNELRQQLHEAEESINRGEGIEMGQALEQLREKYGL